MNEPPGLRVNLVVVERLADADVVRGELVGGADDLTWI
jgi:hypothetical protein